MPLERFRLRDALVWDIHLDGDLDKEKIGQALMIRRSEVDVDMV